MMPESAFFRWIDRMDGSPWGAVAGRNVTNDAVQLSNKPRAPLYTAEQRRRRDGSKWTMVQGILAPLQFLVFLISLALVLHYVFTGRGLQAATVSVVIKTVCLYAIMITGAIWEHEVFERYLFAPAFFWEDAFSMLVLALHTLYIISLVFALLGTHVLMLLALGAYASYAINATQFVMKLRLARLDAAGTAA